MNAFSDWAQIVNRKLKRSSLLDWLRPDHLERRSIKEGIGGVAELAHGWLLDIGCANRPYQEIFDSGVTRYVGLECPGTGAAAQDLLPDVWGNALRLPFLNRSFDTVLSTQTLEHISDPFAAVHEMARVLKPGGFLILSAPQTWPEHFAPFDYFRSLDTALQSFVGRLNAKWSPLRHGAECTPSLQRC